jgi:hypothetical protein
VKRAGKSEADVVMLMEFLGEEVDGALTMQKIRRKTSHMSTFIPMRATLHMHSKNGKAAGKIKCKQSRSVCFVNFMLTWHNTLKELPI